jgi:hypothetical protein
MKEAASKESIMRKRLLALLLIPAFFIGPAIRSAHACPMCSEANAADENRPKAYMYSILFMMSMPALIFTGFGVGLYRLHRKHALENPPDPFDEV